MASDGNSVGFGWVFHLILFLSLAVLFFMQIAVLVKLDKSIEKRADSSISTSTPAVKAQTYPTVNRAAVPKACESHKLIIENTNIPVVQHLKTWQKLRIQI